MMTPARDDLPTAPCSLTAAMIAWLQSCPDREVLGFISEADNEPRFVTYAELHQRAAHLAATLRADGTPGDRALILHEPGLDYVIAFLACLYAGIVAVPAYPPRPKRGLDRLARLFTNASCAVAITSQAVADLLGREAVVASSLRVIVPDAGGVTAPSDFMPATTRPEDVAYLQYTSGSTLTPRGVMVTHGNLAHNIACIAASFRFHPGTRGVIWLPPYHDMGLIGGILTPLIHGYPCLLMTPATAIRQPVAWLRWIGRFGATVSGGPDFAYRHAAQTVTAEQKRELDLSTWEVAFCGAEPIRAATLESFAAAFAPCGFRRESFLPCYGLAEATLIVSGSSRRQRPRTVVVDAPSLARGTVVTSPDGKPVVGCGPAVDDTHVAIVDDAGRELPEGQAGEIWVTGPGVSPGYWAASSLSAATFGARLAGRGPDAPRYLRTGDLGFLLGGELYVTGRIKELLIVRGRKFHPQDIEELAEAAVECVRPSGIVAFAIESDGGPAVALAVELDRAAAKRGEEELVDIARRIRGLVGQRLDVAIGPVAFIRPGGLPRTSSGKLQRTRCGELFAREELPALFVHHEKVGPVASVPGDLSAPGRRHPLPASRDECAAAVERLLGEIGAAPVGDMLALDSLKIVQFAALVERDFGLHLKAVDLFAAESADQLTTQLMEATSAAATPPVDPAAVGRLGRVAPLSVGQQGLWFIDSLTGESAAYNTPFAARVAGPLDLDALRLAVEELPRRHAALRVGFRQETDGPVQVDPDGASVVWEFTDASGWSEHALTAALAAAVGVPFRLQADQPLRCHVFRVGADDHVVLLVTHHIRVDFWSFQLILRDVLRAADRGALAPLPRAGHYFDFVRWQQDYLASERARDDQAYWRAQLIDAPALDLPLDRPGTADPSGAGAFVPLVVDAELHERLQAFCREQGFTTGMVLLAAYGLLLQSLSGRDDVVIGVPFSGRTRAEFFDTVGYFVNPLPQRVIGRDDDTVASFLDRVRSTMLAALDHQEYPSVLMAREVHGPRAQDGNTLFQTMMVLNQPHRLVDDGMIGFGPAGARFVSDTGLEWTEHVLPQQFTKFDLVLAGLESPDTLRLALQYRADVFDRQTVARFAAALQRIIAQLVDDGSVPLAKLDPLSKAERLRVEAFEAGSERAYDLATPIHRRVERQMAATPDAVACRCDGRELTYGELNTWANAVADRLRSRGAGRGRFVGVLVDRSLELPVAWLGVMKSGAAFVPLDPEWPIERLRRVAERCDLVAVVATTDQEALADKIGPAPLPIADWIHEGRPNPDVDVGPEDPIYAFGTSGSTGEPKCAIVPHRGIANRFAWMDEFFGATAARRVLQTTRQVYDSAVWQLFWPLVNGGATVIPPAGMPLFAETVLELVSGNAVTMTDFVPSVFNMLVGQIADDHTARRALASLEVVILGGEEITPETTRAFMTRFPGIRVVNLYGPTEASIGCVACDVEPHGAGRIPIGRPIANVRVRIVDHRGRRVPIGSVGEIVIGGAAVGLGYAGDPDATSRAFGPDLDGGSLVYRTGDLARWLPDGAIDFRGRRDDQVKIRGHRIELAEVEGELRRHPDVVAAVVTVYRPPSGGRQLLAHVVGASGKPDGDGIVAWLRGRLPVWMVPAQVVALDELPLTPGGKIDRGALPPPPMRSRRPPETDLERRLAAAWCRVLNTESAGLDDDFFASGGDSLLATQFVTLVQQEFGVALPLRELFESPTLANLTAVVAAAHEFDPGSIGRASAVDERNAAELLDRLDSLSEQEVYELASRLETEGGRHDEP